MYIVCNTFKRTSLTLDWPDLKISSHNLENTGDSCLAYFFSQNTVFFKTGTSHSMHQHGSHYQNNWGNSKC